MHKKRINIYCLYFFTSGIVGAVSRIVVVINGNLKFEEGYPDDSASEAVPIDARLVLDNDSLIIVNGNLTMGEFSTIYA